MGIFEVAWFSSAIVIFLVATVVAACMEDLGTGLDVVGVSLIAGAALPLLIGVGVIFAVLFGPFFFIRWLAQHKVRKEMAFSKLDAELDKHIEEARQLSEK